MSGKAAAKGLARRAADLLRAGPVHTLDLAREVLSLEGHAGAAASAVFHLLGKDERFHVDDQGVWSLSDAGARLGCPLEALSYAVVDVETTGGRPGSGHRVTEIAVVEVRDGSVVDEFQTLVNPGRSIPSMIQRITGITPEMVVGSPWFDHVADEVAERLEGRVFVAHNVGFDWRFVQAELSRAGVTVPSVERLCTVRLARLLVPRLRRRNLDELTRHFGVRIHGRHRAYGDALATARVLLRLLDEAAGSGLHDLESLQRALDGRRGGRKPSRDQTELFRRGSRPSSSTPESP